MNREQSESVLDAPDVESTSNIPECAGGTFEYRQRAGDAPSYVCRVPADTHYISMVAGGGSGGYASDQVFQSGGPGGGGVIGALVPVIPGEVLSIYVGQGAHRGPEAMPGFVSGGHGGGAPSPIASQGGGGGGSSAVVGSKSGLLIHAGAGGGAGGAGGSSGGGDGGSGGLPAQSGTHGINRDPIKGGSGGQGGDPRLPKQAGNGHSAGTLQTSGGGGGGGGGAFGGAGGGSGDTGTGGGGGGGGASFVVLGGVGITEQPPRHTTNGSVVFGADRSIAASLKSGFFQNVYLRLDAKGVTKQSPVGGVVNCQFGARNFEHLRVHAHADGTLAFESADHPNIFLRMDASGFTKFNQAGGGIVNCQFGQNEFTAFRIVVQSNGVVAIASVKFSGVFLRMDGRGIDRFMDNGGGIVNCQFGVGGWETFNLPGVG
jgi:hypothetical protein